MSNKNQVEAVPDRPLTKSELAEVVRLRVEAEFQEAKAAYEDERQKLLLELKNTELREDKKPIIAQLDECEKTFSRLYTEFRSGRRHYLIEEDERRKNRQRRDRREPSKGQEQKRRRSTHREEQERRRRDRFERLRKEGYSSSVPPARKTRESKPADAASPKIPEMSKAQVQDLQRQGFRVIRVYSNRADCAECGKRVELTPDKRWRRHRWAGHICNPVYTNIVFVKLKAGKAKPAAKAKAQPKKKTAKAKPAATAPTSPIRLIGLEGKPLSAAEKRKAQKTYEEATTALRDMRAGTRSASNRSVYLRGRRTPVAITKVVLGGAMGSNRRRR